MKQRSDSEIANQVRKIYIESKDLDDETLNDHWQLSFSELCDILFEDENDG